MRLSVLSHDLNELKVLPQEAEVHDLVRRKGRITGKDLMELNVKKKVVETNQSYDVSYLNKIWDMHLTKNERQSFNNFANKITNKINNEDTLRRIARMDITQETPLPPNIPGEFYKGYGNFDNNGDDDLNGNPERLILGSVFSGPSSDFQWA
jgi:hypothetical protein